MINQIIAAFAFFLSLWLASFLLGFIVEFISAIFGF